MRNLFLMMMVAITVITVGCERAQQVLTPVMNDGIASVPDIKYWHIYDQETLRIHWEGVPEAAAYVVSLYEDHGGPVGTREEILEWFVVEEGTDTFIERDLSYFANALPGRAKWFAVSILPVDGVHEGWHPHDYLHARVKSPASIPFFWYAETGDLSRFREFVLAADPGLWTDLLKPILLRGEIDVTDFQKIVFYPPPFVEEISSGMRYEVVAFEDHDVVYHGVQYGVQHGIGTGEDAPVRSEISVSLPEGMRSDYVMIRPIWHLGGGDHYPVVGVKPIYHLGGGDHYLVVGRWLEVVFPPDLSDLNGLPFVEGLLKAISR